MWRLKGFGLWWLQLTVTISYTAPTRKWTPGLKGGVGYDLKALRKVLCLPVLPMPEMFLNLQTPLAED